MPTGSVPNAYTCGSPGTHEDLVRATALGAAVSRARPGGSAAGMAAVAGPCDRRWPGVAGPPCSGRPNGPEHGGAVPARVPRAR
jgi:hypothetical protein